MEEPRTRCIKRKIDINIAIMHRCRQESAAGPSQQQATLPCDVVRGSVSSGQGQVAASKSGWDGKLPLQRRRQKASKPCEW